MHEKSASISQGLLILGALLFLIGLLQGTVVQLFHSPRLALSAHIAAVQNGIVLLVLGLLWARMSLTAMQERVTYISAVAGMYLIWIGFTLAAMTGASIVLRFAGAGYAATDIWEIVVGATIYAGSGVSIVSALLVVVGLLRFRVR